MSYIEYYESGFGDNLNQKKHLKNFPYLGFSADTGETVFSDRYYPNNEIWYTGTASINLNSGFGSTYLEAVEEEKGTYFLFDGDVTSIGKSAFSNCRGLTSITIPNSVTSIGEKAFYYCSSLTSITIPNSVTSIGESAFWYCKGLTSITIPNSVTSIGNYAFSSCSSLTSMVVAAGNTVYDSREQCNAIIHTATNTLIRGCQNTIIPNSVTSIGKSAFQYCSSLTSIVIPNGVTSIEFSAFSHCSSLTSVTIPNSVTSVGNLAFANCSSLESIVVESDNTTYDSRNNCNAIIKTATNTLITGCKNTIIPNSVTSIGELAFYYCPPLESITIPNSVTSIEWGAFMDCSLETITCEATTPPTLDSNNNLSSVTAVYVPAESVDLYKVAANWNYYVDKIQAIPS